MSGLLSFAVIACLKVRYFRQIGPSFALKETQFAQDMWLLFEQGGLKAQLRDQQRV